MVGYVVSENSDSGGMLKMDMQRRLASDDSRAATSCSVGYP